MSCEGNRLKFFDHARAALGVDTEVLEKIYQSAKAAGVPAGKEEEVTEKTRRLFRDMQEVGLKPPTHSPDGLPRVESRAGYAAVFDYLRGRAQPTKITDDVAKQYRSGNFWVEMDVRTLLNNNNDNQAGFFRHRYRKKYGELPLHVWYGIPADYRIGDQIYSLLVDGFAARIVNEQDKEALQNFLSQVDAEGYLSDGYSVPGFDRNGYDSFGVSLYGLTRKESLDLEKVRKAATTRIDLNIPRAGRKSLKTYSVDVEGFDDSGFRPENPNEMMDRDRFGYNRLGFRNGRSWTGYDENGLDAQGQPAPRRPGYDAWGYDRKSGLTAPDDQGRRYNLIGWIYDPATDECYHPQNPSMRMKHSESWMYSAKHKKVILKRSYVPEPDEMIRRIQNPAIRWEEYQQGGAFFRYGALNSGSRVALITLNAPEMRYARLQEHAKNGEDVFSGALLRCPRCGQFTGARPHICPAYENRKILPLKNGILYEYVRGAYHPGSLSDGDDKQMMDRYIVDALDEIQREAGITFVQIPPSIKVDHRYLVGEPHYMVNFSDWAHFLWGKDDDEMVLVRETPFTPLEQFDPDYHGGVLAGYHWKYGLDRDGYDPLGFHYISKKSRSGQSLHSMMALGKLKMEMGKVLANLREKGKKEKELLEATYSRIASAIAGAARRVSISEEGGPRPGMFWTDMRGRIQAERYPLKYTPNDGEINNLLAMKAGIYHELGHEEDTPVGIFQRILDIANGREAVEGLPVQAAGLVAEVYNILEDGRMERSQAKRRRGVAAILAADAQIHPRWDEMVGDEIPVGHQVMGMMLYRALPFFRVRQEVFAAAPERVRKMYLEIEPLIDRAMLSPEETFQAAIEITRRLVQDEDMRQLAEQMTRDQSQGGKWVYSDDDDNADGQRQNRGDGEVEQGKKRGRPTLIISALPRPGTANPNQSLSIPEPGWGRPQAQEQAEAEGDKQSKGNKGDEGGSTGEIQGVTPEINEDFFSAIASNYSMDDVFNDIVTDIRKGVQDLTRSPLGKILKKPLSAISNLVVDDPDNPEGGYPILDLTKDGRGQEMHPVKALGDVKSLRNAALQEGPKIARRLEVMKDEITKKMRLQTSGQVDRKRFKRALSGSETLYAQTRQIDVTSLAVSIQLDMSGSMSGPIRSGKLAGSTLALENALQRLGAEYMVSGFGTHYALFKSFGDQAISDEQVLAMMSHTLGGTNPVPVMRLAMLGLKESTSANKLSVILTDGAFDNSDRVAQQAEEMRRNGIIPFGIYFQNDFDYGGILVKDAMDEVFGAGNWVVIQNLSDLSNVVARRIEQIYRKILASR